MKRIMIENKYMYGYGIKVSICTKTVANYLSGTMVHRGSLLSNNNLTNVQSLMAMALTNSHSSLTSDKKVYVHSFRVNL